MENNSQKGKRLIFVGGAPRSGTTLLQNMLDSHSLIAGGPEFLHLPDIIELRRKFHYSISVEYISIFCSKNEVDSFLVSWVESLLLPLADESNCQLYSEKTPENILVSSEMLELFTQSHFIQVIRDPRAIVSSMQQVKNRAVAKGVCVPVFTENHNKSIDYVRKCFVAGFSAAKNYPDRVLTVVYEQLIQNPVQETQKICNFLGVEWSEDMLTPKNKKHLGEQAITANSQEIWYDKEKYNRNPDCANINKWKNNLSMLGQAKVIQAFKDDKDLLQCGYVFSFKSVPLFSFVLVKIILLSSSLRRRVRNLF